MAAQNNEDVTRFDIGSADEIATCTSCHMGGGPYEIDRNGNRYDEFYAANKDRIAAGDFGVFNGDYYRYEIEDIAAAPFYMARDMMGGGPSPALSAPKLHDWSESGVLEAECLTCHLDPYKNRLRTADGVYAQNYSPRLRVFVIAKMNEAGDDYDDILAISFGRYPEPSEIPEGYEVVALDRYSGPLDGTYEPGRFYSALNSPVGTTRDSVKAPILEGGRPDEAGGTNGFKMHNAYSPAVNVVTAANGDKVWGSRKFLGYYFRYAATGGLMGLDLDGDGVPLAYVKLVKKEGVALSDVPSRVQNYFEARTYYDPDDLDLLAATGGTKAPILASHDTGSHKWDLVCARCHVAFQDPVNGGLYFRPDIMGMKADIPKRGTYWKMDYTGAENYELLLQEIEEGKKSEAELAGYDVHAARGVECVDCHTTKSEGPAAPDHNFGKGIDTGGTVRNDLDFHKVKVCRDCHGIDAMKLAHRENFGSEALVEDHFERVACETCHIPYKKYWPFRAFDYSMGFTYNFDSRYMPNPQDPGDVNGMTPFSAFAAFGIQDPQPGYYAAAPFYGIGGLQWAGQSNPLYGMDVVTSIAYFDPRGPDALVAGKLRLEGKDPGFGNRPLDPYAMFYTMMTDMDGAVTVPLLAPDASPEEIQEAFAQFASSANGKSYFEFTPVLYKKPDRDGKIKIYPGNPVVALTWIDYEPSDPASMRVLAPRQLNSILAGAVSREVMPGRHQIGVVLINSDVSRDETGAITGVNDPATVIWDDNFDLRPEISNETELDQVRSALEIVLAKEDRYAGQSGRAHHLRLAIVAHYFSISHNVLPASQALGAPKDYDGLGGIDPATGMPLPPPGNVAAGKTRQCVDCHAQGGNPVYGGDPDVAMNARLSNRRVTFVPWTIENFDELVRKGKIWVEPETGYVHPIDVNGDGDTDDVSPDFSMVKPDGTGMVVPGDLIGATQAEILEHTDEAAEAFARLAGLTPVEPGEEPQTGETAEPPPAEAGGTGSTGCFLQTLTRP